MPFHIFTQGFLPSRYFPHRSMGENKTNINNAIAAFQKTHPLKLEPKSKTGGPNAGNISNNNNTSTSNTGNGNGNSDQENNEGKNKKRRISGTSPKTLARLCRASRPVFRGLGTTALLATTLAGSVALGATLEELLSVKGHEPTDREFILLSPVF